MNALVERYLQQVRELCRAYGIARLELVGSACTDAFDPETSDIHFLVFYPSDYDYGRWMGRHFSLEEDLSRLFERNVDLSMESALDNPWFRREAQKTRRVIYDANRDVVTIEAEPIITSRGRSVEAR
jgi:uncharacterized protein